MTTWTQGENLANPSPPPAMSTAEFVRRWPGSERIIALLEAVDNLIERAWWDSGACGEMVHVGVDDYEALALARDAMQSPPPPRARPEHRHKEGRR